MKIKKRTSIPTLVALAAIVLLAGGAAAGASTDIVASDDWPLDSILDPGRIRCPDGEIVVDPLTGLLMCTPGGRTHVRDTLYYSCIQGFTTSGAAEPRFTGVLGASFNANFGPAFGGFVWGSWTLVPSAGCDKTLLEDPEVFWSGRWWGWRTPMCDDTGQCAWIGSLRLIGRGHGGDLAGKRFRGAETAVTYSPPPLPYELLEFLGLCAPGACPVGPEGHLTGTIRQRRGAGGRQDD